MNKMLLIIIFSLLGLMILAQNAGAGELKNIFNKLTAPNFKTSR